MEEAIKKAIEGGWHSNFTISKITSARLGRKSKVVFDVEGFFPKTTMSLGDIFLDPLFWQALGKALGWTEGHSDEYRDDWQMYWHRFIDHLAENKPADSFFEELLTTKP